jgi:hypothetical protein
MFWNLVLWYLQHFSFCSVLCWLFGVFLCFHMNFGIIFLNMSLVFWLELHWVCRSLRVAWSFQPYEFSFMNMGVFLPSSIFFDFSPSVFCKFHCRHLSYVIRCFFLFTVLGLELRVYTLSHSTSIFLRWVFLLVIGSHYLPGLAIFLIPASWAARITGMSHLCPVLLDLLLVILSYIFWLIVNEITFPISFSEISLLVCRKATEFCVLILYLATYWIYLSVPINQRIQNFLWSVHFCFWIFSLLPLVNCSKPIYD